MFTDKFSLKFCIVSDRESPSTLEENQLDLHHYPRGKKIDTYAYCRARERHTDDNNFRQASQKIVFAQGFTADAQPFSELFYHCVNTTLHFCLEVLKKYISLLKIYSVT